MKNLVKPIATTIFVAASLSTLAASPVQQASVNDNLTVLHVYGPGGPLPAMKEAAETFEKETHIKVVVVAGPTPKWLPDAKQNGDIVYSGSEEMMSDLVTALGSTLAKETITPLYLRKAAILVRPGNPEHIERLQDLENPSHHILVVNGAGQKGLWEDVVGRDGKVSSVISFRKNIATVASNSAEAKAAWSTDPSLDAWLIWTIWQVSNPSLADVVPIDDAHQIYRDCDAGLTLQGNQKPAAIDFLHFLQSPGGQRIFQKWGWDSPK